MILFTIINYFYMLLLTIINYLSMSLFIIINYFSIILFIIVKYFSTLLFIIDDYFSMFLFFFPITVGDGLETAVCDTPQKFSIKPRDKNGNPVGIDSSQLSVGIVHQHSQEAVETNWELQDDGSYTYVYNISKEKNIGR